MVQPFCYESVSWPGAGGVVPLASALPPDASLELQNVISRHRDPHGVLPPHDGAPRRARPPSIYWDVVLRQGGDTYISFIRSLHDRNMVRYTLGSRDQVGVFFVKKKMAVSA